MVLQGNAKQDAIVLLLIYFSLLRCLIRSVHHSNYIDAAVFTKVCSQSVVLYGRSSFHFHHLSD